LNIVIEVVKENAAVVANQVLVLAFAKFFSMAMVWEDVNALARVPVNRNEIAEITLLGSACDISFYLKIQDYTQ
jgi:hypothetical protein